VMNMSLGIKKPTRELSVGEILGQSFSLYSANFVQFFMPFLVVGLATGIVSVIVTLHFPLPPTPSPYAAPEVLLRWLSDLLRALIAIIFLIGVFSWIVGTIVNGVAVKYASDLLEKGDANLQEGLSFTISRLASLLAAMIITGVLIAIGLIALVVPGILIAIMFTLVVPVIMIERASALDSLGRSRRLVSNRWGKTFVVLILIGILMGILASILSVPTSIMGGPFNPAMLFASYLITALIQPVYPIALTFLYYSMAAKEAQLAPPPPPPPTVPPAPTPTTPLRFCLQCGRQIPLDAKFCPYCGKEIVAS